MKNSVTIRMGAVWDSVEFAGPSVGTAEHASVTIDRAKAKAGMSGADRRDYDTDIANLVASHVGIKDRRRHRRNNKHKDRRRGE